MKLSLLLFATCLALNVAAQTDTTTVSEEELLNWLESNSQTATQAAKPQTSIQTITSQNTTTTLSTTTTPDTKPASSIIANSFSRSNAIRQTKSNNTSITYSTTPKAKTTKKSLARVYKTPRPIMPSLSYTKGNLLTDEDLSVIHQEAMATSSHNPLFLDWVSGAPAQISKSLNDDDATIVSLRNESKKYISATEPELYDYHVSQLPEASELQNTAIKGVNTKELALAMKETPVIDKTSGIEVEGYKEPRWKAGAKFQIQASQNYISPNWYKGGESNLAINLYAMGYCNYSNHKNLQWDNKLEWKLGANSTSSDSLRWLGINDDLLRLNSKLGLKAFKSFFYTAELDFQTNLFNTYQPQSYVRSSGPFSPIRVNFSLGMDYKYKNELTVFLSPVSYKLVHVADTTHHASVAPDQSIENIVGIPEGQQTLHQLGALLRVGWSHTFNDYIEMEVKFAFFGNYVGEKKGIETDLEVIGNFKINRFLSAKVSLNPRYDSTVVPADGGKPKIQFRELISVGFNYAL